MTSGFLPNPAHGGDVSETLIDPVSETRKLPTPDDEATMQSVLQRASGEQVSKLEPPLGLRRVSVTLPEESWLAKHATKLDEQLQQLLRLNLPGIMRIQSVVRTTGGWLIDFDAPATSLTLAADLQRRTRPWRQAVQFIAELADLVAAAHACGARHGALRPERILLAEGATPVIAEFGLGVLGTACRVDGALAAILGPCTAPEQIRSWTIPVDPRSDVYALGVILYHLLCSRYPFRTADQDELRRAIVDDAPQPPRQLAQSLPHQLEQLCLRLLAKEPFARPANAEELSRELRQVLAETETIDPAAGLTVSRTTNVAPSNGDLWMIVSWESPSERSRLQDKARDFITRNHGIVHRQSEFETIAKLPPADSNDVNRMTSFLGHALTLLSELKPGDSNVGFVIESAESDTLKRRVTRLSGRVSARGLEISPENSETLLRWRPCRTRQTAEDSDRILQTLETEFVAIPAPNDHWEVSLAAKGWLSVRFASLETTFPAQPLVGRTSQLAMLKARWDQACEGMGQFVLLIGDEGSGKTRLIQELSAVVTAGNTATRWIHWSCRPDLAGEHEEGTTIFQNLPANESPPSERNLGDLRKDTALTAAPEISASQRRVRRQQELLDWLKQLAAESPVVFVVENLQWVDPATLAFLHRLMDLGFKERVLTILTFRPEFETPWGSRAHQTQVALSRLTKRHAAAMFSAMTGVTDLPASLMDQLIADTDGIPMFVEGFARAWLRGQAAR